MTRTLLDWKRVILQPTDTMIRAIDVLNKESLRVAMVLDDGGKLLGTITDGDIRRALIKHMGMDTPVVDIMFSEPTKAFLSDDRESILAIMKARDLFHVPIVDKEDRVVGLEIIQNLINPVAYDNPVILMAGGFGKRLRPLTDDIPKPLLKVGSKPILEMILEQFVNSGFKNFYISTHYKAEMLEEYFGDGEKWGVDINYIHEQEPLGTAGMLGLLPDTLPEIPILVMNGDLLTKVNFEHLLRSHEEMGGVATMCVREYDFQVPYGVVQTEGQQLTGIVEKPIHKFFVNAGIYVLNSEVYRLVDGKSYLDMPQLLENRINNNDQVNMFPLHEYWLDIGRIDEYERAQNEVVEMFP
jgi:dTDP-glucose pyrophosphorylase/predicted transcriptional regulator